ncbi:glycosyltransferase family 2 protein [Flavobacteriaceae bacterium MHTCC 0001]
MEKQLLVTIFIPVYNGEKYLRSTLDSIKNQDYKNLEVLLVNDGSTDDSLLILKTYEALDNRFKVFEKKNSGMVPAVLNYIKPHIKGEFFFYLSQDDILSKDVISKLINRFHETNADTILPDMEYYYEKRNDNKKIIGLNGDRSLILSGVKAFTESLNWNIHGFALFNSNLIKKEKFPEDAFDSDEYVTRKLFLESNCVAFSTGTFFYRQDNTNAITKTFAKKDFYRLNTSEKLYSLIKTAKLDRSYLLSEQYNLISAYLKYIKQFNSFHFKSNSDKAEIRSFLLQFKNEHLGTIFLNENLVYALKKGKLRFVFYVMLIKFNVFTIQ